DKDPPGSATPIWKFEADAPGSVFDHTLTAFFPKAGDYTINVRAYVSYDGGFTWSDPGTTTVSVIAITVSFSTDPINVAVGGTATLTASVAPADGTPYVTFATADTSIATVSGNASALAVHGVSAGQTQLQALVNGQVCAMATVNAISVDFY